MSQNIESIVSTVKDRFDKRAFKKRLLDTTKQKLIVTHNGGLFRVTPELFAMLTVFTDPELVLEDGYGNPVLVNREELLFLAKQRYNEVMNSWLAFSTQPHLAVKFMAIDHK